MASKGFQVGSSNKGHSQLWQKTQKSTFAHKSLHLLENSAEYHGLLLLSLKHTECICIYVLPRHEKYPTNIKPVAVMYQQQSSYGDT